jgi:outer membrane autotransporter protein
MSSRMQRPKLKASILALSAALTAMTPLVAFAGEPCNDTPIDTARTGTVQWNGGDCSITSAGSIITTTQNTALAASGSNGTGTLTNSGTISAVQYGISNTGTIGTLINDTIGSVAGGGAGISNSVSIGSPGTIGTAGMIGTLTNNGTITATTNNGDNGIGIDNESSTITTLTNNGTISSQGKGILNAAIRTGGTANAPTFGPDSSIGTLTNNGLISSASDIAIVNNRGTIGTLINNGIISGGFNTDPNCNGSGFNAVANNNGGVIGTFINSGTITNLQSSNGNDAVSNDSSSFIGTLTNSGAILGLESAINNIGTIGTLTITSSGTLNGNSTGIINSGTISVLTNSGTISGDNTGIANVGGNIDTLTNTNTGTINSLGTGISNTTGGGNSSTIGTAGTIGALTNNGMISAGNTGIDNSGTITTLINSGTIGAGNNGIDNSGMIGTLNNSTIGNINGGLFGIANVGGNIDLLTNTGTITTTGDGGIGIDNESSTINVLTNNGTISGQGKGIFNTAISTGSGTTTVYGAIGTIGTLTNSGVISSSTDIGVVNSHGTISTLINTGTITGGGFFAVSNDNGTIDALINSGTISGTNGGIGNDGMIGTLTNTSTGTISGGATSGIKNTGTIGVLSNSGTISSGSAGIWNNGGTIDTLTNTVTGTISGNNTGILNNALIGALTNNGSITGGGNGIGNAGGNIDMLTNYGTIDAQGTGISNSTNGVTSNHTAGTIGTLTNNGTISGDTGINNSAMIGTLTNNSTGTIGGNSNGINNSGTIGVLTNDGTINGVNDNGILNSGGTISTLINNGIISGASNSNAISSNGTIGTLINNGTIGGGVGISNSGTIDALTNSGLITGKTALYNTSSGTIGAITNSGVIAGAVINKSIRDLNISGGTGAVFGTLTGFGHGIGIGADNIGTITNTISNVNFSAGNQLLNDNINVAGHSVINSGSVLQVNNTIAITGNYTQNAAATLQIGVADGAHATGMVSTDNGYGRLVVSGSATFDAGSGVALQKVNSYAFAQGQRFVVVQAANANAHYNDGSLNYSVIGYNGAVTGASVIDSDNANNTDLVLTVGALNAAPPSGPTNPSAPINSATDANAASSLTGLFNYTGTNAGMLNLFNAAAATGNTGEANRAGAQLSPASTGTALVQSTQASSQAVLDVTSAHIDAIRVAQASGSGDGGDSGIATGERPGDVAVWGQAFGGQANQNDRAGASGYRADYNGMLIGADTALNDQWRAGGLFSYANTSIANSGDNAGSSGHVSSYGLTGYAGYAAEKWYLNLFAGAAQQKYSTFRNVNFSGFDGGASGSFDGMQYVASAQAGYPIKLDATTTVTPIAGVTYSRLRQDGYTETGSAAALQIGSASTSSIKSDLGAKLERSFKTAYGDMIPSAQLSWRHEYRNTGLQSVGNFAADTTGTTSFTTQGAESEKDTGVLVLGVTLARSQNLTVAAHYSLEAAGGYNAQTADVRLRYQF